MKPDKSPDPVVRFVLFSGPVELEGLGHVLRIDSARGRVMANGQDPHDLPAMSLDVRGASIVIKTAKGSDRFALAGGAIRQYRLDGE